MHINFKMKDIVTYFFTHETTPLSEDPFIKRNTNKFFGGSLFRCSSQNFSELEVNFFLYAYGHHPKHSTPHRTTVKLQQLLLLWKHL